MQSLELRLTHTYVGTCKHLDKWAPIGTFDVLASREIALPEEDEGDACDPKRFEHFAIVKVGPELHEMWEAGDEKGGPDRSDPTWAEQKIKQALTDAYASHGCACEHDCCGCRSYSVTTVERVTGDLFRVEVHSSRNY